MSFPMPSIIFLPYDKISSSIDSCHLASITKCTNVYCAATAQGHDEQLLILFQKARSPCCAATAQYYVAHSSFNLIKGDYCNCAVAAQLQ